MDLNQERLSKSPGYACTARLGLGLGSASGPPTLQVTLAEEGTF